jgi:hypothetical protein
MPYTVTFDRSQMRVRIGGITEKSICRVIMKTLKEQLMTRSEALSLIPKVQKYDIYIIRV